jgi:ketosteroid isomerase-like protein
MKTRDVVQRYFDRLERHSDWASCIADEVVFTNFAAPVKEVHGKQEFLGATKRFYGTIKKVSIRDILVDGDRACALTRYELAPPGGAPAFTSDVAEIFTVRDDSIVSFGIYFDTAPFPK